MVLHTTRPDNATNRDEQDPPTVTVTVETMQVMQRLDASDGTRESLYRQQFVQKRNGVDKQLANAGI